MCLELVLDLCIFFPWFRRAYFLSLEKAILWIEDSYFRWMQWFEVLMLDLFLTNLHRLASQDIKWWTGLLVDYCFVLISCLDSHSDGTHSLQRIHWYCLIFPNLFRWRNKLFYIFHLGELFANRQNTEEENTFAVHLQPSDQLWAWSIKPLRHPLQNKCVLQDEI